MGLQAIPGGYSWSPKVNHNDVITAMTLTTKHEEVRAKGAKSAGFNVADVAEYAPKGSKSTHRMGLQAIPGGYNVNPKVNHDDVITAMTLTTKVEEIKSPNKSELGPRAQNPRNVR